MDDKDLENKNLAFVKRLEEYIVSCKESAKYSIDRFDILIISLSTGALGFSIAFIKDFVKDKINPNLLLIKISWIVFAIAIIMNLLSQKTSYYSHILEIKLTKIKIKKLKGKENCSNCENRLNFKTNILDSLTTFFNISSLILLIAGIILTLIFININS